MRMERIGFRDIALFLGVILLFLFFGESVGWRGAGLVQLFFSLKVIRERSVGVGWEGFEPSFYVTGLPAILLGVLSMFIAIMLLFCPEQTVMKWGTR